MLSTDGWCVPDYIHTDLQKCWCVYSSTGLYVHKIPCVYQKFPLNSTPTAFKYLKKKGSERKKFCSKLWTSLQGCQYPWAGEPPCLLLPSGLHSSFLCLKSYLKYIFGDRWQVIIPWREVAALLQSPCLWCELGRATGLLGWEGSQRMRRDLIFFEALQEQSPRENFHLGYFLLFFLVEKWAFFLFNQKPSLLQQFWWKIFNIGLCCKIPTHQNYPFISADALSRRGISQVMKNTAALLPWLSQTGFWW